MSVRELKTGCVVSRVAKCYEEDGRLRDYTSTGRLLKAMMLSMAGETPATVEVHEWGRMRW